LRIESRFELLPSVRRRVAAWARRTGLSEDAVDDLVLCVHEAAMNAIEHGNRAESSRVVSIRLEERAGDITAVVRDEGWGFGLPAGGQHGASPHPVPSGRGLPTIRALMDDVVVCPDRGEIRMRLSRIGRERAGL